MATKKPKKPVTWHISPPEDVYDAVSEMAEAETRAIRNMVVVLLREAVVARRNDVGGPG
jgi:hypothetical protein